jgi:lysine-N-methylase
MNGANQCPMLGEDRLCRIQAELGEGLLSHACATYPRIVHEIGGVEEKALTLSCPEAARLVLLTPNLLAAAEQPKRHASGASMRRLGLSRFLSLHLFFPSWRFCFCFCCCLSFVF